MKTALLFAGQGAQMVGMGADLVAEFPLARQLFDQAHSALKFDLSPVCFQGPEAELTRTENAQPAIFLVSWVAFKLLQQEIPKFSFQAAAGLSLGEFTALSAAGVFSFEDGLRLVRDRGRFMEQACQATRGGMAAIIGLDEPAVRKICDEEGVQLANLNCPGQLVISGPSDKIETACEKLKAAGAKRALPLPVAGAYHSPLMNSAQPLLEPAIARTPLNLPSVPVISNVTGRPHEAPPDIHRLLVDQVVSPVLWEQSIRHLLSEGFTRFIELGPGTTLTNFLKRIDRSAEGLNIADVKSLRGTVELLQKDFD